MVRSLSVLRFVLPIGLLLLTGCTSALSDVLSGQGTSLSALLSPPKAVKIEDASSAQISTSSITTPTPNPSSPASVSPELTLASIHMISTTTGWATGWPPASLVKGIFRTIDGGTRWRDVSPPEVPANSVIVTYFLDSANAWLVASPIITPTTATIYHTADGGHTWQIGDPVFIAQGAPALLDFVDPQHGWFMVNLSEKDTGIEEAQIFETRDSGLHWTEISLTGTQANQSTPGSLPLACDKAGLAFADTATGLVTGYCPGHTPLLAITRDEGQTWQRQALPDPKSPTEALSECDCEPGPPQFISAKNGFFVLRGNFASKQAAFLYVTADGGQTWSPRPLPMAYPIGEPDFTTASDGWVWGTEPSAGRSTAPEGGNLYRTRDGGRGWVGLDADRVLQAALQNGDDVATVDFVTEQVGWLVVVTPDQTSQLLKTTDGAQTWTALNIKLLK